MVGDDADRYGGTIFGSVSGRIGRLEMGVERDRGGGKLGDTYVDAGGDAGSGAVHVRDRTVERRPCLVR